ncbi:hypothetical protein BDQ17DRAFT_1431362 [Cyathus striatus]|nr:hypothetical protein BDQ17DRAFT_1431362 [Cyathus striatus]
MSEVNGGDDIEGEQYVVDAEDPDARLLEAALARYRRKMQLEASRALVASHIPDYFNDN